MQRRRSTDLGCPCSRRAPSTHRTETFRPEEDADDTPKLCNPRHAKGKVRRSHFEAEITARGPYTSLDLHAAGASPLSPGCKVCLRGKEGPWLTCVRHVAWNDPEERAMPAPALPIARGFEVIIARFRDARLELSSARTSEMELTAARA